MLRISSLLVVASLGATALAACATRASDTGKTAPAAAERPTRDPALLPNPMLGPQVFTDGVGIVVEVVPLKPAEDQRARALLRITGLKNRIAGVTLLVTRTAPGGADAWTAEIDGVRTHLLTASQGDLGGDEPLLFVPRNFGSMQLRRDREAGKKVDVDEVIEDYKSHVADGSLAEITRFDREFAKQSVITRMERSRKELAKQCGKEVIVDIAWESFPEREDFAASGFCDRAVQNVAMLCKDGLSQQIEISEKLDRIHCVLDENEDYRYVPKTRTWHVATTPRAFFAGRKAEALASQNLNLQRTVVKSASGLYVVVPTRHEEAPRLHAGMGPKLYRQSGGKFVRGPGASVWNGVKDTFFRTTAPGKWEALCPAGAIEFWEVKSEERDRVLATSSFEEPIWTRQAMLLARDSRGTYYYVDQLRDALGGLGYRVFKGPRGRLTLTTMVDIVDDSHGQIFATTTGSLRLLIQEDGQKARWLVGKKSEDLVILGHSAMRALAYGDLGIYAGQELGTICSLAVAGNSRP